MYQMVAGAKVAFVGPLASPVEQQTGRYLTSSTNGLVLPRLWRDVGWNESNVSRLDYENLEQLKDPRYRPNVAVAVGEQALRSLVGVDGITKYRGSVLNSTTIPGLKVVPIVEPTYIVRGNFSWYYITRHDIEKVVKEAQFPDVRRKPYTQIISPTYDLVLSYLKSIQATDLWSLDIETRAESIACVGVGYGASTLCIPLQTTRGPYFSATQELEIWRGLQAVMARCPFLVGQNLTYDLEWLLDYGCWPSGIALDTMLGFSLLYPEFPKGLDMIVSLYTDAPYYKDDGKTWGWKQPDQRLWQYNCQDVFYTLQAAREIQNELKAKGLWGTYESYVNKELFAALEMQRTRLPHDSQAHDGLKQLVTSQAETTRSFLELVAGQTLNVNSPKQVRDYLYGKKALRPILDRQGKLCSDENALKVLRTRYPDCQELELIIKERHLRKKLSSYLNVTLDPDGYLGCSWNVAGTETGRWSSGKSPRRRGLNLQTVPKVLRNSYRSPRGRVFIQPDLSQAEARVVAYLSRCSGLMELFNDPTRSIHMENAVAIFGTRPKKDSKEYVLAKQCLHAANYKMGPERFSIEANITKQRASEILTAYYTHYPEIPMWHQRTKEAILAVGKLVTPLGRDRYFYNARAEVELTGTMSGESWRNAIAYVPQATVPDVLNKGMLKTWQELDYVWLHHQGHDSCLISVPVDKLGEAATRLRDNLTVPIPVSGMELTIPVEVAWGFNWHPMLPWKGETHADELAYRRFATKEMLPENITDELIGLVA
jgi:DNA polymerase I-like protein with 3'-5' exonuclease and polymerase domains